MQTIQEPASKGLHAFPGDETVRAPSSVDREEFSAIDDAYGLIAVATGAIERLKHNPNGVALTDDGGWALIEATNSRFQRRFMELSDAAADELADEVRTFLAGTIEPMLAAMRDRDEA